MSAVRKMDDGLYISQRCTIEHKSSEVPLMLSGNSPTAMHVVPTNMNSVIPAAACGSSALRWVVGNIQLPVT